MKKNIIFAVIIVLILGAIWYLESMKVHLVGNSGEVQQVQLPENLSGVGTAEVSSTSLKTIATADRKAGYQPAIEIAGPTGFINATSGFTLSSLVGKKVILVDFWTYSCINCIRTLPYLTAWYQKYHDQGLEIVGIHTPEFEFEKDYNNVKAAVEKFGIKYPVIMDSTMATWDAYGNRYWPHEYLIDIAGYAVHDHIGEGDYPATETEIQKLLKQRADVVGMSPSQIPGSQVSVVPANLSGVNSPETYFGASRNEYLANGTIGQTGTQTLSDPNAQTMSPNALYLSGTWSFANEYATAQTAQAKIFYEYNAGKVFFVAAAPAGIPVEVLLDGKPISAADAGTDVRNGKVMIKESRLYNIVNNSGGAGTHMLELIIDSPGLQAFTFTFG